KHDARDFREVRFHAARCEIARLESSRYRGQAGDSKAPSSFLSAKDLLRLANSEAHKVVYIMKYCRRYKNQTIEPVENAAVSGNEFCRVLEAEVAFDGGKHQIAELPYDANNYAKAHQADGHVERRVEPDKMRADCKERRS